ncbi:MAG: sulfotransferase domain-containing protein [Actinomycetota bacterium]|nr:sulfotransferase domain-containing protein [Actinomycetota bacterium]
MEERAGTSGHQRLPGAMRALGRHTFRAFGLATQRFRPLPDFLIIGTKRGGTTSMYRYLREHPQVLPLFPSANHLPMAEDMKGVHYFDSGGRHGVAWYRSHFPSVLSRSVIERRHGASPVAGEASPYYLFHPKAAERAHRAVPDAKILVMLRNPVERTYSHYAEQRRNGVEKLSLEEALEAESQRLEGEEERLVRDPYYRSFAHEHQSYVAQSEYLRPLRRWTARFPAPQVLLLRSEDFFDAPSDVFGEVLSFLGLSSIPLANVRPLNASGKSPLSAATRRRLESHFESHILALEEYLGRDLQWRS